MIKMREKEKEYRLIQEAKNNVDGAFEELLLKHMPMIHLLAGRLQTSSNLHDELVQAGRIGFMYALRRYVKHKETRLMTYAVPWIIGEMKRELRRAEWQNAKSIQNEQLESSFESRDTYAETEAMLCSIDLQSAFALLSGEEQKLVMLRYFRGKTQKETAELLNKSQAQISKTERKILDYLRLQLT